MNSLNVMTKIIFLILIVIMSFSNNNVLTTDEKQEIQNLRSFTKLYGYVKYFHPSDEASEIDWDKFAIYGVERVINAKDSKELKAILEELFLPIAPTIQIYYSIEKPRPFKVPEDTTNLKVVAWQHYGIELDTTIKNIYKSIRINKQKQKDFGSGWVSQYIDATYYRGKEIKLKAFVRVNVDGSGNQGQLYLGVDRIENQVGFVDDMSDRSIKSNKWQECEIIGTIADDATDINFGCFLNGLGQAWVDGFQLFIKSENEKWENIPIFNPGFEEEDNGRPKIWLANIPGYTYKITHNNPREGDKCLLIENKGEGFLFEEYPLVGEVINKELDGGLLCQIPLALYSDSIETLERSENSSFNVLLDGLSKIDINKLTADKEFVRLGDIVIAWNIFQHFYPYFDVVKVDWDKTLSETFEETLENRNKNDFYGTLRKMIAKLKDGHGIVNFMFTPMTGGLPIRVEWIENKIVITASNDTSLFKKGDIVVSIDGINGEEVLSNTESFVSGSLQLRRYRALNLFGNGPLGSIATIKIIRNDKTVTIETERKTETRNLFFNHISEFDFPDIKGLDSGIYYINLSSVNSIDFENMLDELAEAKGIIFDERWDGAVKSNVEKRLSTINVIRHLINEPVQTPIWNTPQIIYPDQKDITYINRRRSISPKSPHFKSKIVFIVDPSVVSSGETYMGIIEHYKLAEIVGQTTAGCNGNANFIKLPGGFMIMWTGMKVLKHDGSQHHLIGIQPTVPVERTIQGALEGRDEFLEKALEIIKSEK